MVGGRGHALAVTIMFANVGLLFICVCLRIRSILSALYYYCDDFYERIAALGARS